MSTLSQLRSDLNTLVLSLGAGHIGAELLELVKNISEAKSKAEEAAIIEKEARLLKETINKPGNEQKMREMLIRALYCEMLGYSIPEAYVQALNLTQTTRLMDKRVGYLFVALCLHENHEFAMLVINSFRRDLASTNILEITSALTCMSWLISAETVLAVIEVVKSKVMHSNELVRKKAVMVIHRCLQKMPEIISEVKECLHRALCDRDISVMAASLHCFLLVLKQAETQPNMPTFKELVPSFVAILKQIADHKVSREYEYHKMPAPWIQVSLLKILAYLGKDSQSASEHMYEVVREVMRRAQTIDSNSSYSVMYECVRTICTIYPNRVLLDEAAQAISKFITSPNNNLKYMGLELLTLIVNINPTYAVQHQAHVISCLEDPDESIQRKTLNLLYTMTNPRNVAVVAEKLLEHLQKSTDVYLRKELVSKLTSLAERYSVSNEWYIKTMNKVFLLGGDLVPNKVAFDLMRLLSEGTGAGDEEDTKLRKYAVKAYCDILKDPVLPDVLEELAAWVLGEYGYLYGDHDAVIDYLCDLMERPHKSSDVRNWVSTALAKMSKVAGHYRSDVMDLFVKYAVSDNLELSRRCQEYHQLLSKLENDSRMQAVLEEVLPLNSSCEEIDVEKLLSAVLAPITNAAIARGEPQYVPRSQRMRRNEAPAPKKETSKLRYKYDDSAVAHLKQQHNQIASSNEAVLRQAAAASLQQNNTNTSAAADSASRILNTAGPWSRTGFGSGLKAAPKPTLTTTPTRSGSATPSPLSTNVTPESPGAGSSPTATVTQSSGTPTSTNSSGPLRKRIEAPPAPTTYYEHQKLLSQLSAVASANPTPMSEKSSKLASALFEGLGEASPKVSTRSVPTTSPANSREKLRSSGATITKSPDSSTTRTSPTSSTTTSSLVDLADSSPSQPSVTPKSVDLLLELDIPSTQSKPADLLTPEPSSTLSGSVLSAVPLTPTLAPPTCGSLLQRLSNTDPENFDISNLQKSELIVKHVDGFPRSSSSNLVVVKEYHLIVSQFRVWKDNEIAVCLFHSNRSSLTLQDIQIELSLPEGLSLSVVTDDNIKFSNNTATIVSLPPNTTALVVVLIRYAGQLSYTSSLQCSLKFAVSNRPKTYKYRIALDLVDFIRPTTNINVQKFGSIWPAHKVESKQKISPSVLEQIDDIRSRMASYNIHTIEIIKNEAIAAGRFLSAGRSEAETEQLLLVHVKHDHNTKSLDITVRTKDKLLTELASRFFAIELAGKQ